MKILTFNNKINFMFILIFSLYLFLGLIGSFYNDFIYTRYNLFYDTDPMIKYNLVFMNWVADIDRHPFIFVITPILKIMEKIVSNPRLALILFQALIGSLNNILLFSILKKINIRNSTSIFFTLIYAFSFSTLLFVSFPEIYLYSSCINLLLTYFICIHNFKNNIKNSDKSWGPIFIVSLLSVIGFGINLVNIILHIPLLIYFFRKYPPKKRKKIIYKFLFLWIVIFSFLCCIGQIFYLLLETIFPTNSILNYRALEWIKIEFSLSRLLQVIQETLIAPFYSLKFSFDPNKISWDLLPKQSCFLVFPAFIFFAFSIYKQKLMLIPKIIWIFISIVLIHLILNFFYNSTWFLYSQNYLCFLVIIIAYFYSKRNKFIQNIILSLFLLFQISSNLNTLIFFAKYINENILHVVIDALQKVFFIDFIIALSLFFLWVLLKKQNKFQKGL